MKILAHYIAPQVLLIAVADFTLAAASLYVAYAVLHSIGWATAVPGGLGLFGRAMLFGFAINAGIAAMGLYTLQQRNRIEGVLARMLAGTGVAGIGITILDFLFKFVQSRPLWIVAVVFCTAFLGIARAAFVRVVEDDRFRRRVLVYGAGQRASRILDLRRRSDQRGFRIVAFVPTAGDRYIMDDSRVLTAKGCPLVDYVQAHDIDEVVIAVDDRRKSFPVNELLACKLAGISVVDLLEFLERETGRVKVDLMNPAWLIFSSGFDRTGERQWAFRWLDVSISAVISLLAAPVGLLIGVAILLDDGRPVLYRQRRVGLNGREFVLYKFRSMRKDAESGGAQWAAREDDRVTRVGKWLRKLRLDELPQLINVFKGDMSLVGPRPERPEFVRELACKIPYYHERHCVKPGITGWAQLCYPYGASEEDALAKLEYDMYYVKNRSLVFNLMILLQTAEVVLWQKGSR